jgi:PqqD family protein of HPr-rel-A system
MTKRPKLRDDLIVREVDEDYVVYDPVSDITALLNSSAAMVLTQCDGATTVEEIFANIEARFGLEERTVAGDIERILEEFRRRGLVSG